MFPWKKDSKADSKPTRARPNAELRSKQTPQLGLLDVPDFSDLGNLDGLDDDFGDDEAELEAELSALQAGYDIRKVVARKPLSLEQMSQPVKAAKTVHEFNSDEDDDDVNENDPELLAELNCIEKEEVPAVVIPPRPPPRQPPTVKPMPLSTPAVSTSMAQPHHKPSAPIVRPNQFQTKAVPASVTQPSSKAPASSNAISSTGGGSITDVLQERLQNYKIAHENAKSVNDSAKVRRLARGTKTLETMLKSARAGKPIVDEDIPPPVATGAKPKVEPATEDSEAMDGYSPPEFSKPLLPSLIAAQPPPPLPPRVRQAPSPARTAPAPPVSKDSSPQIQEDPSLAATLNMLATRRDQYRQAAKRETKEAQIREYVKIAKKFDMVIHALEMGQEVDLQGMPPPPPSILDKPLPPAGVVPSKVNNPAVVAAPPRASQPTAMVASAVKAPTPFNRDQPLELPMTDEIDDPSVFKAPPPATSTLEALQQRLQKYESSMEEATGSANESKARRMGRIVKQYETAIKQHKAGKPVAFDELPTPPGFAPIPTTSSSVQPKPQAPTAPVNKPGAVSAPGPSKAPPVPAANTSNQQKALQPPPATPHPPSIPTKPQKSPQSLYEKQFNAILERQKLFKVAALEAKKRGDIQAAKEYLRLAKGFEPMISASKCGFPVNMDSLPLPPQPSNDNSFEMVSAEDCDQIGDPDEMYEKLEKDLVAQIEMCARNKSHFSSLGDVNNSQKFETMWLNTKKDLNVLRQSLKRGDPVPRFHYETRTFSIVKCFTDLRDDDLELSIIKGINYACPNPSEIDTYVKFEFPFPPDACPKDKTHTVKNTNNPEYNTVFKLAINRKSRNCTTAFKRKGIKLEVWSKGGFLRNDALLGTATVKLMPLETRCILHDSFDIMEGRKPTGGKLEVKVRLRDPLINKQVETHCEKWLIINPSPTSKKT